jgi:cell wall assembly regulator SMI1
MSRPIGDSWTRIEAWLKEHAPDTYAGLNAPATDDAIRSAEEVLPGPLPDDFRAFYARHDGQSGVTPTVAGRWELLPLQAVLSNWKGQKELLDDGTYKERLDDGTYVDTEATPVGPVRPVWWNEKWIPFADDGAGDSQCIDLDPADGGQVGQIVIYWHDQPKREWVAGSLSEWLARLADDLEAGKYAKGAR